LRFEVGDALVVEPEVLACCLELLFEGAVAGGEGADALLERGVLGGDPLDGFLRPFGLQVPDLAEELADAGALGGDLVVGGLDVTEFFSWPLSIDSWPLFRCPRISRSEWVQPLRRQPLQALPGESSVWRRTGLMVTKLQVSEPQGQGPGTDPRRPDIAIGHRNCSGRSPRSSNVN
jgi:hypothetical protein